MPNQAELRSEHEPHETARASRRVDADTRRALTGPPAPHQAPWRSLAVRLERPTRSTTQRNDPFTSTYITEKPETQLEVFHTSEETGRRCR